MTQEQIKNKAASIRARLHNLARKEGLDLNALIILFMQERILYRLSQSIYMDNFILKGGLLLFAQHGFHGRPTQDMDLLCKNTSNEMDNLARIFKELLNQKHEDGLIFSTDTLTVENIAEDAKYSGVRVKVRCLLGTAANVISIDIGFGDVVVPKPIKMQYPCILDTEPAPSVNAYTMESIIAEKFHAMVKRGIMNSRMKDFCDIYTLSKSNNFEGAVLTEAIRETFERRNTAFEPDPVVFSKQFPEDRDKNIQWKAFVNKAKLSSLPLDFNLIAEQVKVFIEPIYNRLVKADDFVSNWNVNSNKWT